MGMGTRFHKLVLGSLRSSKLRNYPTRENGSSLGEARSGGVGLVCCGARALAVAVFVCALCALSILLGSGERW